MIDYCQGEVEGEVTVPLAYLDKIRMDARIGVKTAEDFSANYAKGFESGTDNMKKHLKLVLQEYGHDCGGHAFVFDDLRRVLARTNPRPPTLWSKLRKAF